VSSWLTSLVDPAAAVNEPVRAKATQLTANVSTEIEKIRSIATFVQQTKYVAVSLNLTRGGGYTPRRSDDVLAKNYGDCKDKATLMRALLKAVGIDAYLVTITADDRNYVRPEWPAGPGDQQMMLHLDIQVDGGDVPAAVAWAVECGATLAEHQPQDHTQVLLDPAGHPFCLFPGA